MLLIAIIQIISRADTRWRTRFAWPWFAFRAWKILIYWFFNENKLTNRSETAHWSSFSSLPLQSRESSLAPFPWQSILAVSSRPSLITGWTPGSRFTVLPGRPIRHIHSSRLSGLSRRPWSTREPLITAFSGFPTDWRRRRVSLLACSASLAFLAFRAVWAFSAWTAWRTFADADQSGIAVGWTAWLTVAAWKMVFKSKFLTKIVLRL